MKIVPGDQGGELDPHGGAFGSTGLLNAVFSLDSPAALTFVPRNLDRTADGNGNPVSRAYQIRFMAHSDLAVTRNWLTLFLPSLSRLGRCCRPHQGFQVRQASVRVPLPLARTDGTVGAPFAMPRGNNRGELEQVHEWHQFISATEFCIRICRNSDPDNWKWCSELDSTSLRTAHVSSRCFAWLSHDR